MFECLQCLRRHALRVSSALCGRAVHFGFFLGVLPVVEFVASVLVSAGGLGIRKEWLILWLPFKSLDSLTLSLLDFAAMMLLGLIGGVLFVW